MFYVCIYQLLLLFIKIKGILENYNMNANELFQPNNKLLLTDKRHKESSPSKNNGVAIADAGR